MDETRARNRILSLQSAFAISQLGTSAQTDRPQLAHTLAPVWLLAAPVGTRGSSIGGYNCCRPTRGRPQNRSTARDRGHVAALCEPVRRDRTTQCCVKWYTGGASPPHSKAHWVNNLRSMVRAAMKKGHHTCYSPGTHRPLYTYALGPQE